MKKSQENCFNTHSCMRNTVWSAYLENFLISAPGLNNSAKSSADVYVYCLAFFVRTHIHLIGALKEYAWSSAEAYV